MIAVGVLSFGFRFPGWILVAGLAFVWLAGLAAGARRKVQA